MNVPLRPLLATTALWVGMAMGACSDLKQAASEYRALAAKYGVSESQIAASQAASNPQGVGQAVYPAGDCIGAVVNGICHGQISAHGQTTPHLTCHGEMINGVCTGPMF